MRSARRALTCLAVLVCLSFVPMAAEFGVVTLQGQTPTYARVLAAVVSESFAYGPDSGFAQLMPHWTSMATWLQVTLGVHAALGSVVLVLCVGLVGMPGIRRRRPDLHRRFGRFTAALGVGTMALAVVYLLATPMNAIYGGPPFAIGLWGMAAMALWSVTMGVDQARRGNLDAHRAFLLLFAATLFVAPSLRLYWVLFGWLLGEGVHATQATAHVLALVVLSVQTPLLAIGAMAGHRRRLAISSPPAPLRTAVPILVALGLAGAGVSAFFGPLGLATSGVMMAVAAGFLAVSSLPGLIQGPAQGALVLVGGALACASWGVAGSAFWPAAGWAAPHLLLGQGAYFGVLALSVAALAGIAAAGWTRSDEGLVHEAGLHLLALTAVPAVHSLLVERFVSSGLGPADAWLGAAVLAPGVLLSVSFYATAFRPYARIGDSQTLLRAASARAEDWATGTRLPSDAARG